MLAVTDSRFQNELLRQAKDAGKIERTFEIPAEARDNTPDAIERALKPAYEAGLLTAFPFGTDFTPIEQALLPALQTLKSASTPQLLGLALRGLTGGSAPTELMDRLALAQPKTLSERFYAALVRGALSTP